MHHVHVTLAFVGMLDILEPRLVPSNYNLKPTSNSRLMMVLMAMVMVDGVAC